MAEINYANFQDKQVLMCIGYLMSTIIHIISNNDPPE